MAKFEIDLLGDPLIFLLDQLPALVIQPCHELVHLLHHEPLLLVVGQGVLQVLVHFVNAESDIFRLGLPWFAHQLFIGHELAVWGKCVQGELVVWSSERGVHDVRVRHGDVFGCPNVGDSNTGLKLVFRSLSIFDSLIEMMSILIH